MAATPMSVGAISAADRAQRSVFVGNIPYEAGEDQLKEIFNKAGPVVSFRIVYDRETGKPKGYGFCEYQDVETAQSAMRNLNNCDFHGRPLRVGVAAGEQSKDDRSMQQAVGGPMIESPYGEPCEPEKAPEAISKAVASLPPEQMLELMKQMKACILNNPNEARAMLLENPQLAYALLQAQIVMKIVDPHVALSMLHRPSDQVTPLVPGAAAPKEDRAPPHHRPAEFAATNEPNRDAPPPPTSRPSGLLGDRPPSIPSAFDGGLSPSGRHAPPPPPPQQQTFGGDRDMRQPQQAVVRQPQDRIGGAPPLDRMDTRGPPQNARGGMPLNDPRGLPPNDPRGLPPNDPRGLPPNDPRGLPPIDPRAGAMPPGDPRGASIAAGDPRGGAMPAAGRGMMRDPRADRDPRARAMAGGPVGRQGAPPPPPPPQGPPAGPGDALGALGGLGGAGEGAPGQDQEKAALIMQVLQLSDEQIALLPADQRQSILILKEQIARSSNN